VAVRRRLPMRLATLLASLCVLSDAATLVRKRDVLGVPVLGASPPPSTTNSTAGTDSPGSKKEEKSDASMTPLWVGLPRRKQNRQSGLLSPEQRELAEFLRQRGFDRYATVEYVMKLHSEVSVDSLADIAKIFETDDYRSVGMAIRDAATIQRAAILELLKRFLASVPPLGDAPMGVYEKYAQTLAYAGYQEVEDVADLDEEDAPEFGMTAADVVHLVKYANAEESRTAISRLLSKHRAANGMLAYGSLAEVSDITDAFVKAGVTTIERLGRLQKPVPGIDDATLRDLQHDPVVVNELSRLRYRSEL